VMFRGSICEIGSASDIFLSPHHPYTVALLAAAAKLRASETPVAALTARATPSAPGEARAGCRFQAHCPLTIEGLCDTVSPPLRRLSPTHRVACHLTEPSN
jgi:oligopeptide/dipeptide ABC transporter ATP-binding protein